MMKPKLILCLALVLSGGLFGCSTNGQHSTSVAPTKKASGEQAWQITLRTAITNGNVLHLVVPGGYMDYIVPPDAEKVLESQPTAELMPFLEKLGSEPPPWKAKVIVKWIQVAHEADTRRLEKIGLAQIQSMGLVDQAKRDFIARFPNATIEKFHISYFAGTNIVCCDIGYRIAGKTNIFEKSFTYGYSDSAKWILDWDIFNELNGTNKH
jgi:hypothetical protein